MRRCPLTFVLLVALALTSIAQAQQADPPREEFRGAWIATVNNLDWPRSAAYPEDAKRTLLEGMIEELHQAGINAVVFQIRPAADAMYPSDIEPWSQWLTGEQGQAPEPMWDPLAFAIEAAHERGMELHAWFNPYRSVPGDTSVLAETHVYKEHPEWHLYFDEIDLYILNPGLPEVRDYVTSVVMDVVHRYDVDGIHFDDYFYPYPNSGAGFSGISDEDRETYEMYPRGIDFIGAWRRDNVNLFVEQVYDSINAVKPLVKLGVSPFGIWRRGIPAGIVGLDAYNTVYADAVAWLEDGHVDYLSPQLYWKFGGGQDYGKLAPWWASMRNGRHLYPGLAAYRADGNTFWNPDDYTAGMVPRQVRFNQARDDIQGEIFFRAENITRWDTKGLVDSLRQTLFRHPAITPPMPWQDQTAPAEPEALQYVWTGDAQEAVQLEWQAPADEDGAAAPRFYAVYRVNASVAPDPSQAMQSATHLATVTGETAWVDEPTIADDPYHYFVTALSANSIESSASAVVSVEGRATAVEEGPQTLVARFSAAYPNPFRHQATLRYELDRAAPVTMVVFNSLGQKVRTLVSAQRQGPGQHTVRWDGRDLSGVPVASGTYFVVLDLDGQTHSVPVVRIR